jgi:hypothetical protein
MPVHKSNVDMNKSITLRGKDSLPQGTADYIFKPEKSKPVRAIDGL